VTEDPEDPGQRVATEDEVRAALEGLTDGELLRLDTFARMRIRAIGPKRGHRDHQDLLQEAFTAVLEGRRAWKPEAVSMANLLAGIVRSTSSHWAELFDPAVVAESQLRERENGPSALSMAPSGAPDPERELRAKEELNELQRHFKDDDHVVLLIEGAREGMGGPEIRDKLGMSLQAYEAARKKLLRYRAKQRGR
jgi:DNA-directed RNA polymerase specialized sigma24 family protein